MKPTVVIHLLLSFMIFNQKVNACSSTPSPFCNKITSTNHDVALVTFIEQNQHSSKAIVIEVLKGNITKDTIDVYDYVFFCMQNDTNNLSYYNKNIGDTLLMILPKIDTVLNSWDTIGNYRFENYLYQTNHLYFNKDTLLGFMSGNAYAPNSFNVNKILYEDFKQVWFDTSKTCADMFDYRIVNVEQKLIAKQINIFPNPTENFLQIDMPDYTLLGQCKILLYNITGEMIFQEAISEKTNVINIENLVSGFYILNIEDDGERIMSKKLVKN